MIFLSGFLVYSLFIHLGGVPENESSFLGVFAPSGIPRLQLLSSSLIPLQMHSCSYFFLPNHLYTGEFWTLWYLSYEGWAFIILEKSSV